MVQCCAVPTCKSDAVARLCLLVCILLTDFLHLAIFYLINLSSMLGKIRQLRHHKDEVSKIASGKECGILFTQNFGDFAIGDEIVSVESVSEKIKFKTAEYESQVINRS